MAKRGEKGRAKAYTSSANQRIKEGLTPSLISTSMQANKKKKEGEKGLNLLSKQTL
jgi:hypothetical protein